MEITCEKICYFFKKNIPKVFIGIFLLLVILGIAIFCNLLNLLSSACEIQNLILLLTAFIILWYTYETYKLRVIDQRRLENEELPVLDLKLENGKGSDESKKDDDDKKIIKLKNISKGNAYYVFVVALSKKKIKEESNFNNKIEYKGREFFIYLFSKLSFFGSKNIEKFNEDDFYEVDNFGENLKKLSDEIKERWKALKLKKIEEQNIRYIKNILARTIQYQNKLYLKNLDRKKAYLLFYLDIKCKPYCSFIVYNSNNTLVHKNSGRLEDISDWISKLMKNL